MTCREFQMAAQRFAEPVLAAELIGEEELDDLLERVCGTGAGVSRSDVLRVLGTGVESLDGVLGGGLLGGRVVGVHCEGGGSGQELCQTLLVNSLLTYHDSTAAVVDTTGNFDILRLYTIILSRLQHDATLIASLNLPTTTPDSAQEVEDVAAQVLDRVKIMRVFDFVGVVEAVGEVRDEWEGRSSRNDMVEKEKEDVEPKKPPKRTMVPDSEDEEEDEEMLFDVTAPTTSVQEPGPEPEPEPINSKTTEQDQDSKPARTKFILIDNLPHVLNPLLKKNFVEANALAHSFLHSLTRLTKTHTLHTLLIIPTTLPRAPSPVRPHQEQRPQQPPPPPSIFSSNNAVLALGNVLGPYVDLGVLVTRVPRRKGDAGVFYREGGARGRKCEMVDVMEIVSDRWEARVGAWGTFCKGETGIRACV
ncbi:hypothetical protein P153DRAFT_399867 [Dothidotthia symphoricarpi CBS 119687]|uniref:Uncharacterized protein n=1 Tax=Dothidotthia symphoricarpi CBS 119687 TaxID=1392245 RepID=A0A6A6A3H0_9PLEO|nr:uncharacterized protein P153DRAFT_399867 [Dothidotthia symphoricarpi CBS 119687]KAF2125725.1 hypothetical protein P153DRAFT_399867 [Dothidotthia symphoricarpi CBS 119687]